MWLLLVTGILAFAATGWVYANPPTESVTEQTHEQTIRTAVNTSATVTGNSSLWTTGTQLSDQTLYPMEAPGLTVSLRTMVPDGQRVSITHRVTLVYQATRDGQVFWQTSRPLLDESRVTSTGLVVSATSIEIPEIRSKLDRYNGDLTGLGQAHASLEFVIQYDTGRYTGTLTESTGVTIAQNGYWLGQQPSASQTHSQPVTNRVAEAPDRSLMGGLLGLGLILLAGAGGLQYFRRQDIDEVALRERYDRNRFEEWISEGQLNQSYPSHDIAVASLTDLVDIAIDSNKRVIHDPRGHRYAVIDDRVVYRFDPNRSVPEPRDDDSSPDRPQEPSDDPHGGTDTEQSGTAWENLLRTKE